MKNNKSVIEFTFYSWAFIIFLTSVFLRYLYFNFLYDFLVEYIFVFNIISGVCYSGVFLVLWIAVKKLQEKQKDVVLLWGMIFLVLILLEICIHISISAKESFQNVVVKDVPVDAFCVTIGVYMTYLLTKRKCIRLLTYVNLIVIVSYVFIQLFSIPLFLQSIIVNLTHLSMGLILDLIFLGIGLHSM